MAREVATVLVSGARPRVELAQEQRARRRSCPSAEQARGVVAEDGADDEVDHRANARDLDEVREHLEQVDPRVGSLRSRATPPLSTVRA